jgi:hypothetical protein
MHDKNIKYEFINFIKAKKVMNITLITKYIYNYNILFN